jgi:putative transport protein
VLGAIISVFRDRPELTFFLVLGAGYLLGRLRVGNFTLGAPTGTLLAGVLVGQLGLQVSPQVKECCFVLFLFAIGFRMGPQFFRGLKRDGLQQTVVSVLVCLAGLGAAWGSAKLLGLDAGSAAGVIAGAMTSSPTIGSASQAIARLPLPAAEIEAMTSGIAVAYSVTYLIGIVGATWFLALLAPRLMRIDLVESSREFERGLPGFRTQPVTGRPEVDYRAYEILPGSPLIGRSVRELESRVADRRLFIERLRRREALLEPDENTVVAEGDVVAITGKRERLLPGLPGETLGLREVDDPELLAIPADAVDVVLTRADAEGRSLAELADEEALRSVYLSAIVRSGLPIAVRPETALQRGDVLKVHGPARRVAQVAARFGAADRVTNVTDMAFISLAIVAGALFGMPSFRWGAIEVGLGSSVGVLLAGIACGCLRATWPAAVRSVPGAALWLFESVGLAGFVGIVGLGAGPRFVEALETSGTALLIAGLATAIVPAIVGLLVGRGLFRMHPVVLLGVCAGAGGAANALAELQDRSKSSVPALGYGVAFAISNILLTLWGTLIVGLL